MKIEVLKDPVQKADFDGLCTLLTECVHAGASIGFLDPAPPAEVEAFWQRMIREAVAGARIILIARDEADGKIVGTAQLALEWRPNAKHRAEVQKVLVAVSRRRQGIAAMLMSAVEEHSRRGGRSLLILDTSEGAGGAQAFYETLGYAYAGGIPGFAMDPDGTPTTSAIYYKVLE
jgi:acetyltransferase